MPRGKKDTLAQPEIRVNKVSISNDDITITKSFRLGTDRFVPAEQVKAKPTEGNVFVLIELEVLNNGVEDCSFVPGDLVFASTDGQPFDSVYQLFDGDTGYLPLGGLVGRKIPAHGRDVLNVLIPAKGNETNMTCRYAGSAPVTISIRQADRQSSNDSKKSPHTSSEPGNDSLNTKIRWPSFTGELVGRNEVRIKNPNDFSVCVGLRSTGKGKDFTVSAMSSQSVQVPNGRYEIYFQYSSDPDGLYKGDDFTLLNNGAEIQIVKVMNGNYGIRRIE